MSKLKLQLLTGYINLGASRDNVAHRGIDAPMTYPETIVLAAIHGGAEHVHDLVVIGEVERTAEAERERLVLQYGPQADKVFPVIGGRVAMPEGDANLPTKEEADAVRTAAEKAREDFRAGTPANTTKVEVKTTPLTPAPAATPAKDATESLVPSLDDLPE